MGLLWVPEEKKTGDFEVKCEGRGLSPRSRDLPVGGVRGAFCSILGLLPRDFMSTPSPTVTTKSVSRYRQMSAGVKIAPTENHCSIPSLLQEVNAQGDCNWPNHLRLTRERQYLQTKTMPDLGGWRPFGGPPAFPEQPPCSRCRRAIPDPPGRTFGGGASTLGGGPDLDTALNDTWKVANRPGLPG